eukprot:12898092-Prorocentrum_lima.AAC.1
MEVEGPRGGADPDPETAGQIHRILDEVGAAAREQRRANAALVPSPYTLASAIQMILRSAPYNVVTGSMYTT